jgi:ATP-dependent HslUV protease ATP-binding subunit HslU
MLRAGALDAKDVDIDVADGAQALGNIFGDQSFAQTGMDFSKLLEQMQQGRGGAAAAPTKTRRMTVREAMEALTAEEAEKLVDDQNVAADAIELVENSAIVFLDEIDKVAGTQAGSGPDVSREGVQRDLLPLIEGTTVTTRHGPVKTDHILFIGAGAFHVSKPSDLLPELQGRMPIRVRLDALTEHDFVRILTEPKNALTKQYTALLDTEGVKLRFGEDGVREIARVAAKANLTHENIGARRLFTILERVLDEVSFAGPDLKGKKIPIDEGYVRARVGDLLEDEDLGRYVL